MAAAGISCSAPQLDARDFFNPAQHRPKPDSKRDQGGFSFGGPIIKNRTFFFVDFEKVRSSSSSSGVVTVPTLAERQGDFSADMIPYEPPSSMTRLRKGVGIHAVNRPQVQYNGQLNVIPPSELDPIGLAVLNLYPKPSNGNEFNNYNFTTLAKRSGLPVRHQDRPPDQRPEPHQRPLQPRLEQLYDSADPGRRLR